MTKKTSIGKLKELIREALLSEINIEDVGDVCFAAGSTHVMKTCKIGEDKYFLKFSDDNFFDDVDPSLQILIEYLAYKVYALYKGIRIPSAQLVIDKRNKKVGIATSPVKGKMALSTGIDMKKLGKMMSSGVYVDILLANWDVVGTGDGNVIVDKGDATRIDPGGSLTFRAQGGRKGTKFNARAGELKTMLGGQGAGAVFQYSDLVQAASTFFTVTWDEIRSTLESTAADVSKQLEEAGLVGLNEEWKKDVDEIINILQARHKEVSAHAHHITEE